MKIHQIIFVVLALILIVACSNNIETKDEPENKLIIAHNNRGPMCFSELYFLEGMKKMCPSLVIEELITDYADSRVRMNKLIAKHGGKSEGVSSNFEYLPFTFVNNHAYSGFNEELRQKIRKDIEEVCK